MQGRDDCITTASGINVIAQTLLALTRQGDHVIGVVEAYGPTRHLLRRTLNRFGVAHTLLSVEDLPGIEKALASRPTRLVTFESPTNPMNKIADIGAIVAMAKAHGALTVVDNTLAGVHQHGQFDVDYFVHSLTKYACGHGDVLAGAVIAKAELLRELHSEFNLLGAALDPHAAFLVQRGLKTYYLRYREQSASALRVAQYLAGHPAVARCYYPGLPSDPGHALAARQMQDFGGVLSLDLRVAEPGAVAAGRRFAESLKLFALAASLGSTESLVMPTELFGRRDLSAAEQRLGGINNATVRLSIGLEAVDDLLADIEQALAVAVGG